MSISLILSHNDLRNTTIDCDSLGIHYQVTSEVGILMTGKTTEIRRWDKDTKESGLVGIWERHSFESDEFKFPSGKTIPVSSFLARKRGFGKVEYSFVGGDGRKYIWKVKTTELMLYVSENGEKGAPIAKFHRRRLLFGRRNAYIELFPGYERTLDSLVLTFLYVEWKRRQSQRSSAAASAGAATAGSSC